MFYSIIVKVLVIEIFFQLTFRKGIAFFSSLLLRR